MTYADGVRRAPANQARPELTPPGLAPPAPAAPPSRPSQAVDARWVSVPFWIETAVVGALAMRAWVRAPARHAVRGRSAR